MLSKIKRIRQLEIKVENLHDQNQFLKDLMIRNSELFSNEIRTLLNRIKSLEKFLNVESFRVETPAKVEQGHRKIVKNKNELATTKTK